MQPTDRQDRAAIIGQQVRAARRQLGLDQQTTALLAGVSERFLRDLEHGKATVRLGHVLDVLDVLGLELRIGDEDA